MSSGVLIIAETAADGSLRSSSLELIGAANAAMSAVGGSITALLPGAGIGAAASDLAAAGVSRVLVADDSRLSPLTAEAATSLTQQAIAFVDPALVLFSNTTIGAEFAPRVAARLGLGIVGDVVELQTSPGQLTAIRPVLGGRLMATVVAVGPGPALMVVRQGSFDAPTPGGAIGSIEAFAVSLSAADTAVNVVGTSALSTAGGVGLASADVVVAGGRGLKEAANFALIEQLATAMGGAVAATRAVTDAGWRPHDEQIGQTGRVISPKLYVGIGISGAVQHAVGMAGSENIVAINRDPDAPIFKIANFGIVGDLFEILPMLTDRVKGAKA